MAETPASSNRVKTYNSRQVIISVDGNTITGYADDGFLTIAPMTDGISSTTGCDGEKVLAIDPNTGFQVKIVLLQTSLSNRVFNDYYLKMRRGEDGMFSLLVEDMTGGLVFQAAKAWVIKPIEINYGKSSNNREWDIETCGVDDWELGLTD